MFARNCAVLAAAVALAAPGWAAPPPKDTHATPDETVAAEPAGLNLLEAARARSKSSNNLKQIALPSTITNPPTACSRKTCTTQMGKPS